MSGRGTGASWVVALTVLAIAWLVLLAALVTAYGPTPSSPWVGTLHTVGAGALLLLVLAGAAGAIALRARAPLLWPPAVAALAVLIVTAAFGMLFAAGLLPLSLAPLQFAFLGATLLLLVVLLARARGAVATAAPRSPPS